MGSDAREAGGCFSQGWEPPAAHSPGVATGHVYLGAEQSEQRPGASASTG